MPTMSSVYLTLLLIVVFNKSEGHISHSYLGNGPTKTVGVDLWNVIQQQQSQLTAAAQYLPLAISCRCHTSTQHVSAASFTIKQSSCPARIATERKQLWLKVFKMNEHDVSNFEVPIDEPRKVENRAEAVQIVDGTLLRYEARVKRTQSTMLPWRLARAQ